MNQKPLLLAATLVALLTIGGAFWLMQKRQVAMNQPVVDLVTETPVQTETENSIDTSDWKTYRNERLGFKVAYPLGYRVSESDHWESFYPDFQASFFKPNENQSFQVVVRLDNGKTLPEEVTYFDVRSSSRVKVAGKEGYVYILEHGICDAGQCSGPVIAIVLYSDSKSYTLSFYNIKSLQERLPEKVITSFDFLD